MGKGVEEDWGYRSTWERMLGHLAWWFRGDTAWVATRAPLLPYWSRTRPSLCTALLTPPPHTATHAPRPPYSNTHARMRFPAFVTSSSQVPLCHSLQSSDPHCTLDPLTPTGRLTPPIPSPSSYPIHWVHVGEPDSPKRVSPEAAPPCSRLPRGPSPSWIRPWFPRRPPRSASCRSPPVRSGPVTTSSSVPGLPRPAAAGLQIVTPAISGGFLRKGLGCVR